MNKQVKFAIFTIIIVIPFSSYYVWASDSNISLSNSENTSNLKVISSFYPLFEFAQKVGQDKVDVLLLVPQGVEPHDWEPTIQDVHQMQNSDLIIINGIGFENWVEKLEVMNYQGHILDTSAEINNKNKILEKTNDIQNNFIDIKKDLRDPHIWLNPVLAKIQVQSIANEFSKLDPNNEIFYQKNAQMYLDELNDLDEKIRKDLSTCKNDFITFHDAFSYFAEEYNLNQHTIISSNDPHSEPTGKTLENVINIAKQYDIKIIFTEETANPKISNVIANELNGKVLVLSPIEISDGGNYISSMNQNLENLKEALC